MKHQWPTELTSRKYLVLSWTKNHATVKHKKNHNIKTIPFPNVIKKVINWAYETGKYEMKRSNTPSVWDFLNKDEF